MTKRVATRTPGASEAAAGDGLAWTKKTRALVYGPRHPHPLDPAPLTGEAAWKALREYRGAPELPPLPDDADAASEVILDELRQEMSGATPPTESTVERELLRAGLMMFEHSAPPLAGWKETEQRASLLVPFWVRQLGARLAAEVIAAPHHHAMGGRSTGVARRAYVPAGGKGDGQPMLRYSAIWSLHLRRMLAHDVDAHREAIASLPALDAAVVAGDADAAHRLAAEEMTPGKRVDPRAHVLFGAITDPALALEFARAMPLVNASDTYLQAHPLVDTLGADAAPVLVALLERVGNASDTRKAVAQAAALADAAHCRAALDRLTGPAQTALKAALK